MVSEDSVLLSRKIGFLSFSRSYSDLTLVPDNDED